MSGQGADLARKLLGRVLSGLDVVLVLIEQGEETRYGKGEEVIRVHVHNPAFYRRAVFAGGLGAAESYMDGDWSCDRLVDLVRAFARSDVRHQLEGNRRWFGALLERGRHLLRRNSRRGSARNIEAHYDLGNDFFELFLDRRMMYSAARFATGKESLDEASLAKLDLVCTKLALGRGQHLLEIGTGWGGLAIHAARHYGCQVTTTTISPAQYAYARQLVCEHGLEQQVEVLNLDYRSLSGQFDRLVSVEMVEAVGADYLDEYFRVCGCLLKPDGLMLLQGITIPEQRYREALARVDFIKKHIFPGGFIPSIGVLLESAASNTDLVLLDLEDLGGDYAKTLAVWAARFEARQADILALGFDEHFLRKWRFYFAYCEGGFRERAISDVHMLLAMPGFRASAQGSARTHSTHSG